jgi:transposase
LFPTPRQKYEGRRRVSKEALLIGILQVLVNGVAWRKITEYGCSYVSCFRYLQELQRRGKLKLIFKRLAQKKTDLTSCAIDTTLVISFEFRLLTGWSGKHRSVGTKVSLFCDKDGLPADVQFGKGSDNDKIFLKNHLRNVAGKRKRVLNLDMMYMNLQFRRDMRTHGVRVNMKVREQDFRRKRGPKFTFDKQIYATRFLLERTNGWVKAFRALRLRRSTHPSMFKAFVYLALIIVLIRQS